MFEDMNHPYESKNIEEFWLLFSYPPEIKN